MNTTNAVACHACGASHSARFAGVTYVPVAHVAPCGLACAGGVRPEERSDAMHGFGACPRLCLAARIERLARVAEDRGVNGDRDGAEEAREEEGRLRLLADAAAAVEAVLPRHAAGLTIEHNPHLSVHMTVAAWVEEQEPTWGSDAAKQRAVDAGDLWVLWWYPDTAGGHCTIAAPTLAELLALAAEMER